MTLAVNNFSQLQLEVSNANAIIIDQQANAWVTKFALSLYYLHGGNSTFINSFDKFQTLFF